MFTLGDLRDLRGRRVPHAASGTVTAAAEYTGLLGWDVCPGPVPDGTTVHTDPAGTSASCAPLRVVAAGTSGTCTPLKEDPAGTSGTRTPLKVVPAGSTWEEVAAAWSGAPDAPILLPTGGAFDVLEVPEPAGRAALSRLERLGAPLGPVAAAPHGRLWFLTAPGTAHRLPRLLDRYGWAGCASRDAAPVGLRALGPGGFVTAPPSSHAGLGPVRWLHPPRPGRADGALPRRLLLGVLAHTCHRTR